MCEWRYWIKKKKIRPIFSNCIVTYSVSMICPGQKKDPHRTSRQPDELCWYNWNGIDRPHSSVGKWQGQSWSIDVIRLFSLIGLPCWTGLRMLHNYCHFISHGIQKAKMDSNTSDAWPWPHCFYQLFLQIQTNTNWKCLQFRWLMRLPDIERQILKNMTILRWL